MKLGRSHARTGRGIKPWPVFLVFLALVLLPTAGVLWFMSEAMRNEQLAVRQKLQDVYRAQLLGVQQELQLYWQARSAALEVPEAGLPDLAADAARVFAERVRENLADSVVVNGPEGRPAYPAAPRPSDSSAPVTSGSWHRAERLEQAGQNTEAATSYAAIAEAAADVDTAARALLAQTRCLTRAGQTAKAVAILTEELGRARYAAAVDVHGRLIAPSAQLRALQLLGDRTSPAFQAVAQALQDRLNDYGEPVLPAAQRRFLMLESTQLDPQAADSSVAGTGSFATLAAEQLAARYLDSKPPTPSATSLQPSGVPEVWHLASASGAVVALFQQQRLSRDVESLIAHRQLPDHAALELLAPGVQAQGEFLVSVPAGGFLQDWQLVLRPEDQGLFATAARQRIQAYRLTGGVVILVIVLLTLIAALAVNRQLRLTRLKNDLLATVSHELKTPLASTRLLVDTLLETGVEDRTRVREYLELIARENLRLSRLVDNFLTFSRMEQNRHSFEREPVSAALVAETAAASVADRFRTEGCRFDIEIAPDLPTVLGDQDALVAVLLNLLDNAFKYSEGDRHIRLRATAAQGLVRFAVQDNGIGMPGRVTSRIFDRFYQADQSLSRPGSGCGLGLSIVQYIVGAHAGAVRVDSRPGEGSTFTVCLPVAADKDT